MSLTRHGCFQFAFVSVLSEWEDHSIGGSEGHDPDVCSVETDVEALDDVLNGLQLLFEVKTPDATGLVQNENDVSRVVSAS